MKEQIKEYKEKLKNIKHNREQDFHHLTDSVIQFYDIQILLIAEFIKVLKNIQKK